MPDVTKRVVLHFPGFEPLDAEAHRLRYERSARQSGSIWNCSFVTGALLPDGASFEVDAAGAGWQTRTHVHVLHHNDLVFGLRAKSAARQIVDGYVAAARVTVEGGLLGYFLHAWRFGLFFLFPFALIGFGLLLAACIALAPWFAGLSALHCLWSAPLAFVLFAKVFLPLTDRQHTLHLFADWRMAVAMARLDDEATNAWLARSRDAVRKALNETADEYLVTSHSMGSCAAVQVIGALLEESPDIFAGKRIVFGTLGSAVLQSGLLRSAALLRSRVGRIARCPDIHWFDVHCLTDAIHFYKAKVVAICGHADAPQPPILFIRFKHMLTREHYRKIKRDMLRVHRQYVLGSDRPTAYDFTVMTAGPLDSRTFGVDEDFREIELSPDGSIGIPEIKPAKA